MLAHWRRVQEHGVTWGEMLLQVAELPRPGRIRNFVAGDFPGVLGTNWLLPGDVYSLADACDGLEAIAFTHRDPRPAAEAIRKVRARGLHIAVSCETPEGMAEILALGLRPVVAVRSDHPPRARGLTVCPAQLKKTVTCSNCRLCTTVGPIVAFRAHGQLKNDLDGRLHGG